MTLDQARTAENAIHLTAARTHWRHDCTGRQLPRAVNDGYDSDAAYFARLRAGVAQQLAGDD
jgi:hypothetical protein